MSFEYHDYKATIYREPYKDKDTIQRWVLSYTSKSSKERYSLDRKSTRLNSSHIQKSRMPSSA